MRRATALGSGLWARRPERQQQIDQVEDVSCYPSLLVELLRRGYRDNEIRRIVGPSPEQKAGRSPSPGGIGYRRRGGAANESEATCGSKAPALAPGLRTEDPKLAEVIAAWAGLPLAVTTGIVAMVRAAGRAQDGGSDVT